MQMDKLLVLRIAGNIAFWLFFAFALLQGGYFSWESFIVASLTILAIYDASRVVRWSISRKVVGGK